MTASKVINQQVFKDGKIVLYQLADRPKNYGSAVSKSQKIRGMYTEGRELLIFLRQENSPRSSWRSS
jgi:hypothetical protein